MPDTLADIQAKYGDNVFPLYKEQMHEPFMELDNGVGYAGMILQLDDKIQCAECGKWYKNLSRHIKIHRLGVIDYKDKYGLLRSTPLVSPGVSHEISEDKRLNPSRVRVKKLQSGHNKWLESKKIIDEVSGETIGYDIGRRRKNIMQHRNRYGLCPAQIGARLEIARTANDGRALKRNDLFKYDRSLFGYFYQSNFENNVEDEIKKYGYNIDSTGEPFEDAVIIAKMRSYVRTFKKIPTLKNFLRWAHVLEARLFYLFSSWRRAKMMAGLDQLLQEVK